MSEEAKAGEDNPNHWQLARDVLAFQFKLAADGLRDLLLVPVSIATAVYGMVVSPDNPGRYFNELLKLGQRSDRWINLFGAVDHYEEGEPSSDLYVRKLEDLIVSEYNKGGMVRQVKDQADELLHKIRMSARDGASPGE